MPTLIPPCHLSLYNLPSQSTDGTYPTSIAFNGGPDGSAYFGFQAELLAGGSGNCQYSASQAYFGFRDPQSTLAADYYSCYQAPPGDISSSTLYDVYCPVKQTDITLSTIDLFIAGYTVAAGSTNVYDAIAGVLVSVAPQPIYTTETVNQGGTTTNLAYGAPSPSVTATITGYSTSITTTTVSTTVTSTQTGIQDGPCPSTSSTSSPESLDTFTRSSLSSASTLSSSDNIVTTTSSPDSSSEITPTLISLSQPSPVGAASSSVIDAATSSSAASSSETGPSIISLTQPPPIGSEAPSNTAVASSSSPAASSSETGPTLVSLSQLLPIETEPFSSPAILDTETTNGASATEISLTAASVTQSPPTISEPAASASETSLTIISLSQPSPIGAELSSSTTTSNSFQGSSLSNLSSNPTDVASSSSQISLTSSSPSTSSESGASVTPETSSQESLATLAIPSFTLIAPAPSPPISSVPSSVSSISEPQSSQTIETSSEITNTPNSLNTSTISSTSSPAASTSLTPGVVPAVGSSTGSYIASGCYLDVNADGSPIINATSHSNSTGSVEECVNSCSSNVIGDPFIYTGVEPGGCFCGNLIGAGDLQPPSLCQSPCPGAPQEACGGAAQVAKRKRVTIVVFLQLYVFVASGTSSSLISVTSTISSPTSSSGTSITSISQSQIESISPPTVSTETSFASTAQQISTGASLSLNISTIAPSSLSELSAIGITLGTPTLPTSVNGANATSTTTLDSSPWYPLPHFPIPSTPTSSIALKPKPTPSNTP